MKLKEIKPGMVIHWKTGDEKVALLEELERLGYEWYPTHRKATCACDDENLGHSIYVYNDYGWKNITHRYKADKVTHEFSDLIIPEMSAEEVLQIRNELSFDFVREYLGLCHGHSLDEMLRMATVEQTIDMCQQWKSEHKKKEPEIETVEVCKIFQIFPDNSKRLVSEEEMGSQTIAERERILKRYCMEHDGEYIAVRESVSRVRK